MSTIAAKIQKKLAQFRSRMSEIQREEADIEKARERLDQERQKIAEHINLLAELEDGDGGIVETAFSLSPPATDIVITLWDAVVAFIKTGEGHFAKEELEAWIRGHYPQFQFAKKSLDRHLHRARTSAPPLIKVVRVGGGQFKTLFDRMPFAKAA